MQRVNDLIVRGKHAEVAKLVERIERNIVVADWKRDLAGEERINSTKNGSPGCFCFEISFGPLRPVTLILQKNGWDELNVSSLITKDKKPLDDVEYNRILGDFLSNVLVPMSVGTGVDMRLYPPRVRIEESLSPDAMTRLMEFSTASKKETTSFPDGLKWDRFVIQAHRDGSFLDEDELHYWLLSDGFSNEDCRELVNSFEASRTLLKSYDSERVGS